MHSVDYHDYVFKDGKLLGQFEEMYKYSKETPWHQDKASYFIYSEIDIAILKQYKYETICDIGCGLGYFTDRLYCELDSFNGGRPRVTGVDISSTAVKKASEQFPKIRFISGDFVKDNVLPGEKFSVVVIKEVFWYVFHNLEKFMRNTVSMIKGDGFLYVSQSFPETDTWAGKEVIDSPRKLNDILASYVNPMYSCTEKDYNLNGRPLLHFLGKLEEHENK